MASMSLCPQFETNLMPNRNVIELPLQLKSGKDHGKNYIKVKPHLVCHLLRNSLFSLRKTVGKVSPILVTLTSRSDSDFESSNVSLEKNKPDGVNPNSNDIILWFSADCIDENR